MRILTGISLITLGLAEKLFGAILAESFLAAIPWNFLPALGFEFFTDRLFALSAGFTEVIFGVILSIAVAVGTVIFARFTEDAMALIVPIGFIAIFASIFIPAVAKSMSSGIGGKIQMAFILMFLSTFAFGTGGALFAEFSTIFIPL